MTASSRWRDLLAPLLTLSLIAAACGGDDGEATIAGDATGASEEGADVVSGEIDISGSSTVEPISTRVAELFEEEAPDVVVNVDGPGTGDGFELFCNGETDISGASRAITDEEMASCEENGVEFIELQVAFDGMAVMTNPANEIECLSFADLYALVGPESEGFSSWSDAQDLASELGSDATFPDVPLEITAPGEESGTYDSFVEIVIEGIADERGQEPETRPDYSSHADDNAIIQGVEGTESSFGWVGLAFAEEAGDDVTKIPVSEEPGGDCVVPTTETIADGSYPISRPLFIYVSTETLEENAALEAYVDFYLNDGITAVEEAGYVALSHDQIGEARAAWTNRTTGPRGV